VALFQDELALWQATVRDAPEKPRAWVNLGRQYALRGETDRAVHAYDVALLITKERGRAWDEQRSVVAVAEANLALIHLEAGDRDAAIALVGHARSLLWEDPTIQGMQAWIASPLLAR
jgi:tetratricopeptide (TPR) repeat protein